MQKPILERKIISVQRPAWVLVQFSVRELRWSLVAHGGVMACVWDMGGADSLERYVWDTCYVQGAELNI